MNLSATTDGIGQQWRTINKAIVQDGNDIIIVGRALTKSNDFRNDVIKYKEASWNALSLAEEANAFCGRDS